MLHLQLLQSSAAQAAPVRLFAAAWSVFIKAGMLDAMN